jgi:hypothetical protein
MNIKAAVFWDVMPCNLIACCLLGLLFEPEDGGSMLLQNVCEHHHIPEDSTLQI